jgi:pimeloyl-ACP methyl ester carboxylesterase
MTLQEEQEVVAKYSPSSTTCTWWTGEEGHRLFTVVNTPAREAFGSVLLLPPFGLHLHNLFLPAALLAHAGFRAVRFDGRDNEGASEGQIIDYRLGTQLEDARSAAAQLVETFGRDDFLIFGLSVSASLALLLAREYPRARVFLLVPIIDLGGTVNRVAKDPGAMDSYRNRSPDAVEIRRVFSHELRAQPFCDDFLEIGIGTPDEMFAVARAVRGRADLVLAENDEYSSPELKQGLIDALGAEGHVLVLEQAGHNVGKSPTTLQRSFTRLVEAAQAHFAVPLAERRPPPADSALVAAFKIEQQAIHGFFNGFDRPAEANDDGTLEGASLA